MNERQRKILNRLLDGLHGKLTPSTYAKVAHCSQDTALHDITDLLAQGLLTRGDAGGRSASYALATD